MTDMRIKTAWRTACTPEEAAEVDTLASRAMEIDAEREKISAQLNRIRQRCCQRLLAQARKAAQ